MKKTAFTKRNVFAAVTFGFLSLSTIANAQEVTPSPSDTLYPVVEQVQSDLKILKRLKLSGLVQFDTHLADTAGISSFAGGDFAAGVDKRMTVRRGRLKAVYENELSQGVIQLEISEGGVTLKDAYLKFTDPWLQTVSITGGVFDRPFGSEIEYSSSALETPERSRIIQSLFPGEKDLGAKITLQAPKTSPWNFLKLDAGLFNGNGGTAKETDSYKDFIGHLYASDATADQSIKWGAGVSYYNGGYAQFSNTQYKMSTDANGIAGFVKETVNKGAQTVKQFVGFDGQLSFDWWLGITQLRGEYVFGTQPGTASSSKSLTGAAATDTYVRNTNGYNLYFIQNIFQSPVQLVVKYDYYDPNTAVSANEIGAAVTGASFMKTNATDAAFSTLGLGLNYRWNSNVKIMAHYDIVTNETSNQAAVTKTSTLTDLSKDRNDNVFTLRVQYSF